MQKFFLDDGRPAGITLGPIGPNGSALVLDDVALSQHCALIGVPAIDTEMIARQVLLQQIYRGGGYLHIGTLYNPEMAKALGKAHAQLNRTGDFHVLDVDAPVLDIDPHTLLTQDKGLLVSLNGRGKSGEMLSLGRQLLQDLVKVVDQVGRENSRKGRPPFLVVIDGLDMFAPAELAELFETAAAAGVTLIVTAYSFDALSNVSEDLRAAVINNTATKVLHRARNEVPPPVSESDFVGLTIQQRGGISLALHYQELMPRESLVISPSGVWKTATRQVP